MSTPFKLLAPQDVLEAYYANLQRSSTIHMVMLDTGGNIVAVNRATARLFTKTPDELSGKDWFELTIPQPERPAMRETFKRILATGLPDVYQNEIRLPDGTTRTLLWSNSLTHHNDTLTGTLSFGIDVTDDVAAQNKLKRSEYLLRRTEEIAGLGTYILDVATGIWSSSEVLDEIFGIGPENPRTVESWGALIHPDDRAMMISYFRDEVIGKRRSFDKEYRIVRASDSSVRWVHGYGALETAPDGSVTVMIGAIRDVTATRRSAEQLRLSDERFRLAARHAGMLVYDWNLETAELAWEGTVEEISGFTASDFPAKTIDGWAQMIHPDDRDAALRLLEQARAERAPYHTHYRLRHRDGSYFVVEDRGSFLADSASNLVRMIGTMRRVRSDEESTQTLTNLINSLPYGVGITQDGLFRFVNPSGLQLMKAQKLEDVIGKPVIEFVAPDFRAETEARIRKVLASDEPAPTIHSRFLRTDGTTYDVEVSTRRIEYRGAPATLSVVRDLSQDNPTERGLLENMTDGFVEYAAVRDADGNLIDLRYLAANPAHDRLVGLSGRDFIGKRLFETLPMVEKIWLERFGRVLETGEPGTWDRASKVVTGKTFRTTAWRTGTDRLAVLFTDITKEASPMSHTVHAEEIILSMSEGFAEHEMIFDAQGNPADYRFVRVNPAFERLTGLNASGIIGKTVREIMPSTEDLWIQRYGEVVKTGKPTTFTAISSGAGAKSFRVSAWRTTPDRFAVIFSDVSEGVAEEKRFRNILNTLVGMSTISDATGVCVFQSAQSKELTGYASDELIGKSIFEFIHPEDLQRVQAEFMKGIKDPSYHVLVPFRFKKKDGNWVWLESIGTKWEIEPGKTGMLISSRDITDVHVGREAAARAKELETVNKALVGRELRISELKEEIRGLKAQLEKANPA